MSALSWLLAAAFIAPPTPPPDSPPVYRTASPAMASTPSPKPKATPTPVLTAAPIRTPGVWRFGSAAPPGAASSSPAASGAVPRTSGPATSGTARDPVRYLTGSSWSCETIAGTPEIHRYVATPAGFDVHNVFQLKNRSVQLDEHYRYHPGSGAWTVTLANGAFVAQASRWAGVRWTFNGTTQTDNGKRFAVRMVYQYFDAHVFRRDFQVRRGNDWITYAAETCMRQSSQL